MVSADLVRWIKRKARRSGTFAWTLRCTSLSALRWIATVTASHANSCSHGRHLAGHLRAIVEGLAGALVGPWELWVRGPFSSDLTDAEPECIDLVLIGQPNPAHEWPLQLITAGPLKLHPGALRLTVIPTPHDDRGFERDREAIRSSRRCLDLGDAGRLGCGVGA